MRYFYLFLLLAFLAACTSSPSPVLPPKSLEPVENSLYIKRLWSKRISGGAGANFLRLTPVVDQNIIYAVDYTGKIIAYDSNNKSEKWSYAIGSPGSSALTKIENNLYFGTSEGQLIKLSSDDGKELWRVQLQSEILASPVIAKGIVIARCVNGDIVALRQDTGKQIWKVEERTPALTLRGNSNPVIYNDLLIVGFDNGKLKSFALRNGKQIWEATIAAPRGRSDLERIVDLDTTPVIINDVIYSVAYQGQLAAIQLGSGQIIWQRDIDSYVDIAADIYRLYVADSSGQVWALDRSNGATLWKQDALLRRELTAPRIMQDHIIVGDYNGYVHWLRRDNGKLEARIKMLAVGYTDPELDESDAQLFPKTNNILAAPVVLDSKLVVTDRFGHTEAFEVIKR